MANITFDQLQAVFSNNSAEALQSVYKSIEGASPITITQMMTEVRDLKDPGAMSAVLMLGMSCAGGARINLEEMWNRLSNTTKKQLTAYLIIQDRGRDTVNMTLLRILGNMLIHYGTPESQFVAKSRVKLSPTSQYLSIFDEPEYKDNVGSKLNSKGEETNPRVIANEKLKPLAAEVKSLMNNAKHKDVWDSYIKLMMRMESEIRAKV